MSAPQPPAPNPRAQASEAAVRQYVNENFEPSDWIAVLVRNRETGETIHRMSTAQRIATPEFQRWLRYKNAHGSDIYLSLNTFKDRVRNRTKSDLKRIRHVYVDLDEDGPRKLAGIRSDNAVPAPNYVLNTSPDKYQVIWKVEAINQEQAETLLRALAQRFGADPAATDSTRVFRLPGFSNKKYEGDFQVTISKEAPPTQIYHATDFNVQPLPVEREHSEASSTGSRSLHGGDGNSQSEKDWAYALRKLKQGEDPEKIIREMTRYRSIDHYHKNDPTKLLAPRKENPHYYAEHTVAKAMAHLGIFRKAPPPPSGQSEPFSGDADREPNR